MVKYFWKYFKRTAFFLILVNFSPAESADNSRDHSLQSRQTNAKNRTLLVLIGHTIQQYQSIFIRQGDITFEWQKSYHVHIIRDAKSLERIKCYIEKNPENWKS